MLQLILEVSQQLYYTVNNMAVDGPLMQRAKTSAFSVTDPILQEYSSFSNQWVNISCGMYHTQLLFQCAQGWISPNTWQRKHLCPDSS